MYWRGKLLETVVVLYYVLPPTMLLGAGYFAGGIWFWILSFMALLWPLGNVVAALAMGQD